MKNLFKTILLTAITTTAFTACSDWTETEPKNPTDLTTCLLYTSDAADE